MKVSRILERIWAAAAFPWDSDSGLWFPLAKVQKFLDNGREDSVQFFAEVVMKKSE